MLRLALPSKGELEEPTLAFLRACGLGVNRPNTRQYTADIPGLPDAVVLFQRAADIAAKVAEDGVDLGITGLDTVRETLHAESRCGVLIEDLEYGQCDLVIAVPDTWIDVAAMADLVEVAEEMRSQGMELRVATKYNRLVRQFLLEKGLNYFSLVASTGAIEVAPTMGFADVIADLTSSGATLRENGLKTLVDGTVLGSQACLVGNVDALRRDPQALATTKAILERMEACLRAREYFTVTANVQGDSAEAVAICVLKEPAVAGIQGPTVSRVYSRHEDGNDWYAATVMVRKDRLLTAVDHLRSIGGSGVTVSSPHYVLGAHSQHYLRLLETLSAPAPG